MRFLRRLALLVVVLIGAGAVLYFGFGLRLVPYGGGFPRLEFVRSVDERAAALEQHRAAQRTTAPPAPAGVSTQPGPTSTPLGSGPAWPEFRGPTRDGVVREAIRTTWPVEGLTPLWKQPVGGGYASFAVAGGTAFTIEQRRAQEVVVAYDVATGRELWTHGWNGRFTESMGGDGPRATPTFFDGRLYALGAAGELRALEAATGKQIWRTNILRDAGASNLEWGMAASPLIVDETVVVVPGGSGGQSVIAYDRRTGERRWSSQDERQAYTSPMLVTLAGRRQILIASSSRVLGLTPDGREVLWSHPWQTTADINAAQPILIGDNRVFFSSAYGVGAAVLEITAAGGRFGVREVWRNTRMKNRFASAVLHDGFIYGFDESIFGCIEAATGELKWKGGRYGYGQVLLASGQLIVLTEEGDLVLVRATPEKHDELARFAAISGKTWNHPAIAGGILLVRNANEMAGFDVSLGNVKLKTPN